MSLILRGVAREIVLVNRDRKRSDGVITDMQYGSVLAPRVSLKAGEYADLKGASLVMITAGVNEKEGGATDRKDPKGRLRLLAKNAEIYREMVPQIHEAAPESIILVVTDPPDPLADVAREVGHNKVLSTGTYLDSMRFRFHLARRLKADPAYVDAMVLGEHGTSSVFLWSSARVGGRPVLDVLCESGQEPAAVREDVEKEVRYANITIIEGIGASQYGIGIVCASIAEMILRDTRAVIPIGAYHEKYGVTLSVPSVVGAGGVLRVIEPTMSKEEEQALKRSAEAIRKALDEVEEERKIA
jgi:L-lactate dehydrogenase